MTSEEYLQFLRDFTPTDDAYNAASDFADYEQARNELVDFVRKNKLDCSHLWDYSREGWEQQSDNWKLFIDKVLELTDRYDLWWSPEEDDYEE